MEKMIIKLTLNARNPVEAELIKILKDVGNKSAYLKMAAFHYHNILGKLSRSYDPKNDACPDVSKTDGDSDCVNTDKALLKNSDEQKIDFASAFDNVKWTKDL